MQEKIPEESQLTEEDNKNQYQLQLPRRVEKHLDFVEFSNDGTLLLGTSNLTGKIWSGSVWLFKDPALAPNIDDCLGGIEFESSIASGLWIGESKIVIGSDTGNLQLLLVTALVDKPKCYFTTLGMVCEHDDSVLSLDLFQSKDKFLSGSMDMNIKLWNVESLTCEKSYNFAHSHIITSVSCQNDDDNIFLSTSLDGNCLLWDVRLEKPATLLAKTDSGYTASAWISDNCASIGAASGNISLIDVRMKNESDRNFCSKRPIHKMKYQRQLGILSVCADDPVVRMFGCKDNMLKNIYECNRHSDFVRGLSWDLNTNRLYSCGWDSKIYCHNAPENSKTCNNNIIDATIDSNDTDVIGKPNQKKE